MNNSHCFSVKTCCSSLLGTSRISVSLWQAHARSSLVELGTEIAEKPRCIEPTPRRRMEERRRGVKSRHGWAVSSGIGHKVQGTLDIGGSGVVEDVEGR